MELFLGAMIVLLLLGSGVYTLIAYFRLRKYWAPFEHRFLLPANCPPDKCLDPDGFLEYIFPRLLIFGVLCCALGIAYLPAAVPPVGKAIGLSDTMYYILTYSVAGIGVGAFVWYMFCQSHCAKQFWGIRGKKKR